MAKNAPQFIQLSFNPPEPRSMYTCHLSRTIDVALINTVTLLSIFVETIDKPPDTPFKLCISAINGDVIYDRYNLAPICSTLIPSFNKVHGPFEIISFENGSYNSLLITMTDINDKIMLPIKSLFMTLKIT